MNNNLYLTNSASVSSTLCNDYQQNEYRLTLHTWSRDRTRLSRRHDYTVRWCVRVSPNFLGAVSIASISPRWGPGRRAGPLPVFLLQLQEWLSKLNLVPSEESRVEDLDPTQNSPRYNYPLSNRLLRIIWLNCPIWKIPMRTSRAYSSTLSITMPSTLPRINRK